jgi:predicted alpha-1,6-mannanase (GH76 family)
MVIVPQMNGKIIWENNHVFNNKFANSHASIVNTTVRYHEDGSKKLNACT